MSAIDDVSLKNLKSLIQGVDCDSLLRKSRSLTSFHVLTFSLCCDTLMANWLSLVTLELRSLSIGVYILAEFLGVANVGGGRLQAPST